MLSNLEQYISNSDFMVIVKKKSLCSTKLYRYTHAIDTHVL
jgi:hypothetical protein